MNRRTVLSGLSSSLFVALAGCGYNNQDGNGSGNGNGNNNDNSNENGSDGTQELTEVEPPDEFPEGLSEDSISMDPFISACPLFTGDITSVRYDSTEEFRTDTEGQNTTRDIHGWAVIPEEKSYKYENSNSFIQVQYKEEDTLYNKLEDSSGVIRNEKIIDVPEPSAFQPLRATAYTRVIELLDLFEIEDLTVYEQASRDDLLFVYTSNSAPDTDLDNVSLELAIYGNQTFSYIDIQASSNLGNIYKFEMEFSKYGEVTPEVPDWTEDSTEIENTEPTEPEEDPDITE